MLAQFSETACPRANIAAEYGQELYLSEIPDEEAPTVRKIAAIRKDRNSRKSPKFAEWAVLIYYNSDEESI